MKTTRHILLSGMFVAAVMAAAPAASAQQTTGTPGSPSATTTVDGKYVHRIGNCIFQIPELTVV